MDSTAPQQVVFLNAHFWIGFFCAISVSYIFIDRLIQLAYRRFFRMFLKEQYSATEVTKREIDKYCTNSHLYAGATIGKLERSLYIFSVMTAQYSLLAGWLVLKAFFGWISARQHSSIPCDPAAEDQSCGIDVQNLILYYSYIYGNALSLIAGIGLGIFGQYISTI